MRTLLLAGLVAFVAAAPCLAGSVHVRMIAPNGVANVQIQRDREGCYRTAAAAPEINARLGSYIVCMQHRGYRLDNHGLVQAAFADNHPRRMARSAQRYRQIEHADTQTVPVTNYYPANAANRAVYGAVPE